jgi:hypothetical protein
MFDIGSLVKYLLEGLAVGIASFLIPAKKMVLTDIILVAVTAAAVFAVLDIFTPLVAAGSRQGTGFALGYQQLGLGKELEVPESPMKGPARPQGPQGPLMRHKAPSGYETQEEADLMPVGQEMDPMMRAPEVPEGSDGPEEIAAPEGPEGPEEPEEKVEVPEGFEGFVTKI